MATIGRKRIPGKTSISKRTQPLNFTPDATVAVTPTMIQVAGDLRYEFGFGINNFSHDIGAVQFDELARPLQLPLLQVTAATLQTVSFDFLVASPIDGVTIPIEDELRVLQNFAAEDNPVIFDKVHAMLSEVVSWQITSLSVRISRINKSGKATNANVSMSCTESSTGLERFLTLPKFAYKNPKGTGKGKGESGGEQGANPHDTIEKFFQRLSNTYRQELTKDTAQANKFIADLKRLAVQFSDTAVGEAVLKAGKGKSDWNPTELFNNVNSILNSSKNVK